MDANFDNDRVAEFLRTTFETIDQGVAIYDQDLRLVAWNELCRKLFPMPEELYTYGASLADQYQFIARSGGFGPGDPDMLADRYVKAMRDGPMIDEELLTSGDNRDLRVRRFRLPNGGVCATIADITAEIEVQEQLRQSSKMDAIGRLTGGVAHDFNNVLAVVMGNLELLLEALEADEPTENTQLIEAAIEASSRGARLTHRLLAFARKQPLSPTVMQASGILKELVPMLRTLLGEHIEIELVCDAGLWAIEADRNQLENVIVNIAVNARDAMRDGGKLTIEASNTRVDQHYATMADIERGQYVCISCADTGSGMNKEVVEKAFEPFFTTKAAGAGTGLGLSMAHGFIKQSNGHIKIYSEVGEGTVVKIYLPRAHAVDTLDRTSLDRVVDTNAGQKRILVVEDDEQFRDTVRRQLQSAGYRVLAVKDGLAALKKLEDLADIDVLLTDVVLPGGINGRETAERALKIRPNVKVIYMSGYSENAIIHHGRLDEGVVLIQKPFRKIDLIREVVSVTEDLAVDS